MGMFLCWLISGHLCFALHTPASLPDLDGSEGVSAVETRMRACPESACAAQ